MTDDRQKAQMVKVTGTTVPWLKSRIAERSRPAQDRNGLADEDYKKLFTRTEQP